MSSIYNSSSYHLNGPKMNLLVNSLKLPAQLNFDVSMNVHLSGTLFVLCSDCGNSVLSVI